MTTDPRPDTAASPPGRRRWRQLHLTYPDWRAAEAAALGHLLPLLDQPDHRLRIPGWWYVRKGPTWRVRLHMPFDPDEPTAQHLLTRIAAHLAERTPLQRWSTPIYEPETHAFGGPKAMAAAHTLFVADSRHILAALARTHKETGPDLRRELALVLATQLLRGAGLEWSEQGDVWHRVATRRTDPDRPAVAMTAALVENAHLLLTANAATTASPLHHTPTWPAAFTTAGVRLAELAATGRLTRGLRAVLTHHLLFGFNRLGIPATHQHRLATAAVHAVFGEEPMSSHPVTDHEIDREADRLRQGLADHIRGRGTFHTAAVEKAFRVVPRHAFLPDVPLPDAYAARPVVTRRDTDGSALSSASSPNLVAGMLELLDVAPGQRIMEIGAATGINAALLAELTGPTGHVTTIEIDDGLAQGARDALARTGYPTVTVITGDGALGHPPAAPFDRIIVTAGAWDIPAAWWQQLAPDGCVVIPLRLHGSGLTRVLPLTRHATNTDALVSTFALVCGFVPMRGTGEHAENMVRLTEDAILNVDIDDHPDPRALTRTLTAASPTTPPLRRWTGIRLRDDEPVEHLDLWLATNKERASAFGRLSVGATARDNGIDPARRWAGAGIYHRGSLAYLTLRPDNTASTTTVGVDELGIAADGPDAKTLADELADLLAHWDDQRPAQPVITATPTTSTAALDSAARMTRPHTTFSVTW